MRTTVTIDPDVAEKLQAYAHRKGLSFKKALNELILRGLSQQAERLLAGQAQFAEAFNFGPSDEHRVGEVVEHLVQGWGPNASFFTPPGQHPHEAGRLHLDSQKARQILGWEPQLDFAQAVSKPVQFYRNWNGGGDAWQLLCADLAAYSGA